MSYRLLTSKADVNPRFVAVQHESLNGMVYVGAATDAEPERGAWITAREARKVARWLLKAADKADG